MAPQKDHATLISAFGRIAAQHPNWSLRILGEGELRESLTAQIAGLGMTPRIALPGAVKGVGEELAKAQLFVIPSRYESFGLVTAEALAHGLPVIGFADCPGTNELVATGINGVLAEGGDRVAALAASLSRLMGNEAERIRLANAAQASVATLALDEIALRWEYLIEESCDGSSGPK